MPETRPTEGQAPAGTTATALLSADHETVRQLRTRYEAPGMTSPEKRLVAHEIFRDLDIHASLEEKIFYPAVAKALGDEGRELVAEAIAEHTRVKNAIAMLRTLALPEAAFDERLLAMLDDVDHHATEEEREMFPRVEDTLGTDNEALGARMTMLKDTLLTAKTKAGAA